MRGASGEMTTFWLKTRSPHARLAGDGLGAVRLHALGDFERAVEQRVSRAERLQRGEHVARGVVAVRHHAGVVDLHQRAGVVVGEGGEPRQNAAHAPMRAFVALQLADALPSVLQLALDVGGRSRRRLADHFGFTP